MSMSLKITGVWKNNKAITSGIHYESHRMNVVLGEKAFNTLYNTFMTQVAKGSGIQNVKEVRLEYYVYPEHSQMQPVRMKGTMFSGIGGIDTLNEAILCNIINQGLMCLEQARCAVLQSDYDAGRRYIG